MDTTTRFLMYATLGMTGMMAATVALLVGTCGSAATRASEPPKPCDERTWLCPLWCSTESPGNPCPEHMYCYDESARCELTATRECEDGEDLLECVCPADWFTHGGHCWREPPEVGEGCDDPSVKQALGRLFDECHKQRRQRAGKDEEFVSCDFEDFEDFAMNSSTFDGLISAFPDHFAVLFPNGRPGPLAKRPWAGWPGGASRAFLRDGLRRHREALARAKHVILVSRASVVGDKKDNYELGMGRLQFVEDRLTEVFGGKGQTAMTAKLTRFNVGDERPIPPELFTRYYAKDFVAWDRANQKSITGMLDTAASGGGSEELRNVVNRVVFIIPIPCDVELPTAEVLPADPADEEAV